MLSRTSSLKIHHHQNTIHIDTDIPDHEQEQSEDEKAARLAEENHKSRTFIADIIKLNPMYLYAYLEHNDIPKLMQSVDQLVSMRIEPIEPQLLGLFLIIYFIL